MSGKYHLNGNQEVGRCTASVRDCPYGGDSGLENHFSSKEEASAESERRLEILYNSNAPLRKKSSNVDSGESKGNENSNKSSMKMNPYSAQLGDKFVNDAGEVFSVDRVTPAGVGGVSFSSGPVVHLRLLKKDGSPSDYVESVQFGGYRTPDSYSEFGRDEVDVAHGFSESKSLREVPSGRTKFNRAVIGFVNVGGKDYRVVAPAERLTKSRREALGKELFLTSGGDPKKWDSSSEESRDSWTRRHMGRYDDVVLDRDNGAISYSTKTSVSGNHSEDNFRIYDFK